jgi:type IV pilus assembly protein PilW
MLSPNRLARRTEGFSLIEIMVAMAIGLFGVLIIMQVFLTFQGQKRTTMGAADAQENALIALHTIERDGRVAGLGLVGLGCPTVNAYNANMATPSYTFSALPATIAQDSPAVGTDSVTLRYSSSPFAQIPTKLITAAADSDAVLTLDYGAGFSQGVMFMIAEGAKNCSMMQASATSAKAGVTWDLQHGTAGSPYSPPAGTALFPAGGYGIGARVANMGTMVNRQYFVQNEKLMMRDVNVPDNAGTNPIALVDNIFAIKAQYGRDTGTDGYWDVFDNTVPAAAERLVSLRLAVVARSGTIERGQSVSPATLVLWSGGTVANGGAIALSATDQQYRFKVYQTVIPLRNVIWTN